LFGDTDTFEPIPLEESPPARAGRSWRAALAAAVLFLGGIGLGWGVSDGRSPALAPSADRPVTTSTVPATTAPPATSATTASTVPPVPGTTVPPPVITAPSLPDGDEPIADIAAAILPSMVQIELGQGANAGLGSGVIYDPNGLIITAAHVVDGYSTVTVRLYDGTRLQGTVVGSDSVNDIGVVSIPRSGLQAAALAVDEQLRVGQLAVAIGSPWGLESTVTSGIVSAVDRPIEGNDGAVQNMIQTDASINPGNSGGALVDRDARVIGINVSIFTDTGSSEGVGFAVPIDRAYRVAQALAAGDQLASGFLGISGQDAPVGSSPGTLVQEVTAGTAADDAGLQVGDLITEINGDPVSGISQLAGEIRSYEAGQQITLTVVRNGTTISLTVTLGAR
jgi:putative serine protease PepD